MATTSISAPLHTQFLADDVGEPGRVQSWGDRRQARAQVARIDTDVGRDRDDGLASGAARSRPGLQDAARAA